MEREPVIGGRCVYEQKKTKIGDHVLGGRGSWENNGCVKGGNMSALISRTNKSCNGAIMGMWPTAKRRGASFRGGGVYYKC